MGFVFTSLTLPYFWRTCVFFFFWGVPRRIFQREKNLHTYIYLCFFLFAIARRAFESVCLRFIMCVVSFRKSCRPSDGMRKKFYRQETQPQKSHDEEKRCVRCSTCFLDYVRQTALRNGLFSRLERLSWEPLCCAVCKLRVFKDSSSRGERGSNQVRTLRFQSAPFLTVQFSGKRHSSSSSRSSSTRSYPINGCDVFPSSDVRRNRLNHTMYVVRGSSKTRSCQSLTQAGREQKSEASWKQMCPKMQAPQRMVCALCI